MLRIFLVRHGETEENLSKKFQKIESRLSKKGIKNAIDLSKKIKGKQIDEVISSDLLRAKETLKCIGLKKEVPLTYSELFREKEMGVLGGRSHAELNNLNGDFETRKPRGGESLLDVKARAIRAFQLILKHYRSKGTKADYNILVITHGAFIKIFLGYLLGLNLKNSIFKMQINHCCLIEIKIDLGKKDIEGGIQLIFK